MIDPEIASKITIITCFLNTEQFLEEAIESVLAQEYFHWELLLIDDGSTDNSTSIAKKFASLHPDRIFYFEHEGHINKGLSASRNLALKEMKGDLVTFLDGDDVWLPNYLSHQLKLLQRTQASMICEGTLYWYSWNNPSGQDKKILVGVEANKVYYPPQLMVDLYPLGKGAAPCVCSLIVKKEVFLKYGGFDDNFRGMYEDQVFLSKVYLNEPVFVSDACNNLYRQRRDSLVSSSQDQKIYYETRVRFLNWLIKYIQENNIAFRQVNLMITKALSHTGSLLPYYYPRFYFITNRLPRILKFKLKQIFFTRFKKLFS